MTPIEKEISFFREGVGELETYLLSPELYWKLPGGLPRLTIGGLLLARARLSVLAPDFRAEWDSLDAAMTRVRDKWQVSWEKKAAWEVSARFNLWKNYIEDYRTAPERFAVDYPHETRWRVMLTLLMGDLLSPPPEAPALDALDTLLRHFFIEGEFIWESPLLEVFPKSDYWFLYGTLKE